MASLALSEEDRRQLKRWAMGGSTPYRLVVRAHIVLLAASGHSNRQIVKALRVNPLTVRRWRSRFALLGLDGLRTDAPRLGPNPRLSPSLVATVLRKTLLERPPGGGRWSTRSLAQQVGVSHSTIRRIWRTHGIRPGESRLARLAREPLDVVRPVDILGVYVNPPRRAIALSVGGRARSRPSGAPAGAASPAPPFQFRLENLYSALHVLDGLDERASTRRLGDREFLAFLRSVQERRTEKERVQLLTAFAESSEPAGFERWLLRNPSFSLRAAHGGTSLQRLVSEWASDLITKRSPDPSLGSVAGLRTAVDRWLRDAQTGSRPFAWVRNRGTAAAGA